MNEVKLRFILGGRSPYNHVACISEASRLIYLNIPKMKSMAKRERMTFDDFFATCISHELIHQIIYDTEGDSASGQFENICHEKYKIMKHWIGGVGGK